MQDINSKIEMRRSSLFLKYRYTVPGATPASAAISETFALKKPWWANTLTAESRIRRCLSPVLNRMANPPKMVPGHNGPIKLEWKAQRIFERRMRKRASFRPERALFRPWAVGPPAGIATACGGGRTRISTLREAVPMYASAQPLDFLARAKNASSPNRKLLVSNPGFPDGHELPQERERERDSERELVVTSVAFRKFHDI